MRSIILTSAILFAGAAHGQAGASQAAPNGHSDPEANVIVDAPDRQVCRSIRRTGTRMRASRVCRTVAQWDAARQGRTADDELAEAADTLEAEGRNVSTGDLGGMGGTGNGGHMNLPPPNPLGPR